MEYMTSTTVDAAMDHILKNRPAVDTFPTAREIFESSYKEMKDDRMLQERNGCGEGVADDGTGGGEMVTDEQKEATPSTSSSSSPGSFGSSPSTSATTPPFCDISLVPASTTTSSPAASESAESTSGSSVSSSKPEKRRPSVLPPCRVCNSKASGLHYGVVTCEACNGFFRRSLKRGAIYLCSKDKKCEVRGKKRGECSFCRYQRCLNVGMSKSAVKTGRYSDKTRLAYAIETENHNKAELFIDKISRLDTISSDVVQAHDKHVLNLGRVPDLELFDRQFKYFKLYSSQSSTVDSATRVLSLFKHVISPLPLSLDLRDTSEVGFSRIIAAFLENWLRHYIKFVKKIPGFGFLDLNDQATLVRATWHEIWLLGAYRGFNAEMQVAANPNGTVLHYDEMKMVFGKVYADLSYKLSTRLQKLQITPEEAVLIKMMCMTYPDRHRLEKPEQVRSLHWLMSNCLMRELEKNHPEEPMVFSQVVSMLVDLRSTLYEALLPCNGYKYKHFLDQETPLLKEIMAYMPGV